MEIKGLLRGGAKDWFKLVALVMAGCGALYFAIVPLRRPEIEEERAAGLASQDRAVRFEPQAMWRQASFKGILGGAVPHGMMASRAVDLASVQGQLVPDSAPPPASESTQDRKMVRTDAIDLVVWRPAETAEQVRALAARLGGFLATSQVSGDVAFPSASLTIRVPAARFEEARTELRKLGLRVDNERIEAQDVTRQYVDQEAHLRNLRAEEQQYLAILKRAATVKDTLEVSEKLSEIRGQIEQQQAEFETLSKQVETVAITVALRAESDAQVLGLHWRPLYQLKLAFRDGLNGLADYAATMAAVIFYLPAILLWTGTILVGLALTHRVLRWARRMLFPSTLPAKA